MSPARSSRKSSRPVVPPAEPLRLWAIAGADCELVRFVDGDPATFTALKTAEEFCEDGWRVVEFIEVRQPAERTTEWGDCQFDHVQVGPGVTVALRITPEGRVKMLSPGGEIDVTDGSASLGTGLHEAGRRAAQIRVQREERARRRAERKVGAEAARVAHLPRSSRR